MTPAAPTANWRKVCEEYFSRLIEDLEPQVDSEVESRVTAAVEAAVHGAVADAVGESRRALAEELNQGVRRLRNAVNPDELYATLLDVTVPFCDQAAIFSIHETVVRAERMRRPVGTAAGEDAAAGNLPPLEFPLSQAAAFASAVNTCDPVIAMGTPAEISAALAKLFSHESDQRVFLFPLVSGGKAASVFCAAENVQAPPVELLAGIAGLELQSFVAGPEVAPVEERAESSAAAGLVAISGPAPRDRAEAPPQHHAWRGLSRDEQQKHLAAQRFARVQIAEMWLGKPGAVRSGRVARDLYSELKPQIDTARNQFREKYMTLSPSMVDYLHLELVRSLAHDEPILLGPNYPGPLA
jgi:hypothetical protein